MHKINYTKIEKFRIHIAKRLVPYGYHVKRHPDIRIVQEVQGVPENERWFMLATDQQRTPYIFDHRATLAACIYQCQVMGYTYDIEFNNL